MILHGKAKEEFLKQFCGVVPINEIELNAHIIDWFDEVGINLTILPYSFGFDLGSDLKQTDGTWSFFIYKGDKWELDGVDFDSRNEATTEAIKKAVEIFNSL